MEASKASKASKASGDEVEPISLHRDAQTLSSEQVVDSTE